MIASDVRFCGKFGPIRGMSKCNSGDITIILRDKKDLSEYLLIVPTAILMDANRDEQDRCFIDILRQNGRDDITGTNFASRIEVQIGFH